jgi:histidyl-tRNA synthetase
VLVLGPDEIAKGVVTVKDMREQNQFEIARGELAGALRLAIDHAGSRSRRADEH